MPDRKRWRVHSRNLPVDPIVTKNEAASQTQSVNRQRPDAAERQGQSWGSPGQDDFLESMAEAAKAIADRCGENIIYISVMNNLSVDCDCSDSPADPEMHDVGILASLDPVALDKACVDKVYESDDHGKIYLIERMESRNGIHTVNYAEQLGLGTTRYKIINMDEQ